MKTPVFGITGYKDVGKTTLTAGLVEILSARGLVISTVKHAHEIFEIDHEGRDSYRHRQAGALEVAVVSRSRWAIVHELGGAREPSLASVLEKLSPCDLILIEGYKEERHAKIEVRRKGVDHPGIAENDSSIVAIASDMDIPGQGVPVFDLNDIVQIADFIVDYVKPEPGP